MKNIGNFLRDGDGLRRIGMLLEKSTELEESGGAVAAPEIDFGKRQLGMREVRGVELDRNLQVLLGWIRIVEVELTDPKL